MGGDDQAVFGALEGLGDGEGAGVEVEVAPAQAEDFALARSGAQGEFDEGAVGVVRAGDQEFTGFLGG